MWPSMAFDMSTRNESVGQILIHIQVRLSTIIGHGRRGGSGSSLPDWFAPTKTQPGSGSLRQPLPPPAGFS